MRIIRFGAANEYLIPSLSTQTLFFSNALKFNDPFEGVFRYKISPDYEAFKKFYLKDFSGRPDKLEYYFNNQAELEAKINKTFDYRQKENGLCCFAAEENATNVLMWSHYARDHSGVCLVFESEEMNLSYFEPKDAAVLYGRVTGPFPIRYTDQYFNENAAARELNQTNFLTTKSKDWAYEKEFRFIGPKTGLYHYDPNSLKEIILGERCLPTIKEEVKIAIEQHLPHVNLKRIQKAKSAFRLELMQEA